MAETALVTGAGSGIGRAAAIKLAQQGAMLVVNDIRERACCDTVSKIEKMGFRAVAITGDVSDAQDVDRLVKEAAQAFDPPQILVNNAGFLSQTRFVDMSTEEFDRMIAVHLRGTFLCTRAVLPGMLARGSGVVVNIASQLGQIGGVELCHYSAANAGIIGLTKALAREVSGLGVRVNAVAPGPVHTDLSANLSPTWVRRKTAELPLGRFGEAEEIADTIVFLTSSASTLYVGQTLGPNSGDVML